MEKPQRVGVTEDNDRLIWKRRVICGNPKREQSKEEEEKDVQREVIIHCRLYGNVLIESKECVSRGLHVRVNR